MYVHVESDGYIKRSSNGLISAYSVPNLHAANIPQTGRSMADDNEFHDASETVI
jgi:hypothetical protein